MIQVNRRKILDMKPRPDRLDNYLEHYSNWSGSLFEFLDLTKITQEDKCCVYFQLMPFKIVRQVVLEMAELSLPAYESAYVGDTRLRQAIEQAKRFKETDYVLMDKVFWEVCDVKKQAFAVLSKQTPTLEKRRWKRAYCAANAVNMAVCVFRVESRPLSKESAEWALSSAEDRPAMEAKQTEIMKRHLEGLE